MYASFWIFEIGLLLREISSKMSYFHKCPGRRVILAFLEMGHNGLKSIYIAQFAFSDGKCLHFSNTFYNKHISIQIKKLVIISILDFSALLMAFLKMPQNHSVENWYIGSILLRSLTHEWKSSAVLARGCKIPFNSSTSLSVFSARASPAWNIEINMHYVIMSNLQLQNNATIGSLLRS